MRQTYKWTVAVREVVGEASLAQPVVHGIAATVDVEHVLDEIVDEEKDVYIVDVFCWFNQIIRFVWLRFEWRIVLAEVPRTERCLRK